MKHTPDIPAPIFHPAFRQSMPRISQEVRHNRHILEPIIDAVESLVSQVQAYLRFEIDKVVVATQKADWEGRTATGKLKERMERLTQLEARLVEFDMRKPFDTLEFMLDEISEMSQDQPP